MVPMPIRQFFEAYRDAFARFNGDAVAACFHTPCIMARRDRYALWATTETVRASCAALVAIYHERGTERFEYTIRDFLSQGPHFAVVTLDWAFFSPQEPNPLRFHATYNLFEQQGQWRILLCTVFD